MQGKRQVVRVIGRFEEARVREIGIVLYIASSVANQIAAFMIERSRFIQMPSKTTFALCRSILRVFNCWMLQG